MTDPQHPTPHVTLHHGNNLHILPTIPDASIDSIVTDPPYELGFMGKQWDSTGIAYNVNLWTECLRVLKPGGHLLAFGGTRTYHRMAVAIEDAGFDIRDSLHWIYGSGFPKSMNVSKAIDKMDAAEEQQARRYRFTSWVRSTGLTARQINEATGTMMGHHYTTHPTQPAVMTLEHLDTVRHLIDHVPQWVEEEARKRSVESRNFAQREVIGQRDVPVGHSFAGPTYGGDSKAVQVDITAPATDAAKQWEGWGTALKPAHEPIVLARKPLIGTVAANVLQHGTGALNIDACRIGNNGGSRRTADDIGEDARTNNVYGKGLGLANAAPRIDGLGRWPANVIIDDTITDDWARYFYCAKPSRTERNAGLDGLPEARTDIGDASPSGGSWERRDGRTSAVTANFHPTVKPLALMQWLIRLVTPPDGTVLDPFAGSGTTLAAATLENINSIGIELTDDYLPIITARCQWAETQHNNQPQPEPTLFDNYDN